MDDKIKPAEKYGLVIGGIGVVVGLIGAFFGWLAFQASWTIATESGAFDKPGVTLGVGGYRLNPGETAAVIVGMTKLSEGTVVAIGTVPFSMVNEGKKTADTPSLTFRFHKLSNREGLTALQMTPSGPFSATEVKTSLTKNDPFDYMSYQMRALDPGVSLSLSEPFYATETKFTVDAPVTFKDGVEATISITGFYSLKFLATVTARDSTTLNFPIEVAVTKVSSMEELVKFAHEKYVLEQIREFRKEAGFLKYLAGLLFRSEERRLFLSYEVTTPHPVGEGKSIEFASGSESTARVLYSLLSWQFLFANEKP
jgi:hypothetical protein